MSTIVIRDLAQSEELDRKAMSAVHGGSRGGFTGANVNISNVVGVGVQNNLYMPIGILNHSEIGAPVGVSLTATPEFNSEFKF
jgi:hypothetical protein